MLSSDRLIWGITAHLIVDWLFQNSWMAENKANLRHPAGYVHAGLHTLALLFVFPWPMAFLIGVLHLLIDTRIPLKCWAKVMKPAASGEIVLHIALWRDQVLHILVIALAALLSG